MTDEQIIKAADICRTGKCSGCPYHELYTASCLNKLTKDVYHLLNRRKAEIEKLKVELKAMRGAANSYKLECERLEKVRQKQALFLEEERGQKYELYNVIKKTKSEAIKEFAERLKKEVLIDRGYEILQLGTIEYLVKEMTEVKK